VGEDGLDGEGGLDGGDNAQPAATAGTSEDIEREHAVHQRWPGPGARGDGRVGAGFEGVADRGRAAVADDLRAPVRTRGEDAVIQEHVHRGPGNEGRQLLQAFDGLEEEVRRAITPDRLEFDENAPVGAEADAILGERGAEQIATELLQASAIVGGDPDVGVEVEAVELGLTRAAGDDVTEVWLVAEASDAGGASPRRGSLGRDARRARAGIAQWQSN
jgi:hypothetical protein